MAKPRSIDEAIEMGTVKDVYMPGIDNHALGAQCDGAITEVQRGQRGNEITILIAGHTALDVTDKQGYVDGNPTALKSGDYVRIHDQLNPHLTEVAA